MRTCIECGKELRGRQRRYCAERRDAHAANWYIPDMNINGRGTRGLARTYVITAKGRAACEAMDRERGK